jgi:AcrR family transcriptional regulator
VGPPPEKTPRFRRAPNEKRARIIGAAHELFSRDGYGAATTAEIAKLAGVSEGTVFHHFRSKEGLLRAAAAQYGQELVEMVLEIRDSGGAPIEQMLESIVGFIGERGRFGLVLMRDTRVPAEVRSDIQRSIVGVLSGWIGSGSRNGSVRDLDPEIGAEFAFAVFETMLESIHGAGSKKTESYLREATYAIRGILAPEPRDERLGVRYADGARD